MAEEIEELQESSEKGSQHRDLAPVSITMSILAVLLAATTLLGHRAHTEEILLQNQSTDQWNFYQAKNIRRHTYESFLDLMSVSEFKNAEAADKIREKYRASVERNNEEQKEIETEARKLEKERDGASRRGDRFDLGEGFLEIALVITSLTLLTRRRLFWAMGGVFALAGVAVSISGLLLH